MNKRSDIDPASGFTIIEMSVVISVSAIVILGMARLNHAPTVLISELNQSGAAVVVRAAADVVVHDLREADRYSMPLTSIDPSNTSRVIAGIDWFRIPQINAARPYRYVKYAFQADTQRPGYGSLVRSLNLSTPSDTGATLTTVLADQLTPSTTVPVFVLDRPQSSTIVVTLKAKPSGQRNSILATRRVTLRN